MIDSVRNSSGIIFKPLDIPSSELNLYNGVYSNSLNSFKIIVGVEKNHLSLSFNNFRDTIIMEAIEKNIFWGHGFKLKFDPVKNEVQFSHETQSGEGIILKKEK